jgi:hypothetical protein
LLINGKDIQARGLVFETDTEVAGGIKTILKASPAMAGYLKVHRADDGEFNAEDLRQVAAKRVIVQFQPAA